MTLRILEVVLNAIGILAMGGLSPNIVLVHDDDDDD